MTVVEQIVTVPPKTVSLPVVGGRRRGVDRLFNQLDIVELPFVQRQVSVVSRPFVRVAVLVLNRAADGWLYALIGAVLLFAASDGLAVVAVTILSLLVAHAIYRLIKATVARPRPSDRDSSLGTLFAPLDRYSCPSGHCMTATVAFIPISLSYPLAIAALAPLWLMIGWARLAAGHHYPSDLFFGALLGVMVAGPISYRLIG
jgi:undecaprenyl-diphosphatase